MRVSSFSVLQNYFFSTKRYCLKLHKTEKETPKNFKTDFHARKDVPCHALEQGFSTFLHTVPLIQKLKVFVPVFR